MVKNTSTKFKKELKPLLQKWGANENGLNNRFFSGLSYDSRSTKADDIFFCIKGEHFDGNDFRDQAKKAGAVLIVSESEAQNESEIGFVKVDDIRQAMAEAATYFFDDPSKKLRILGVTGTNGKTSTTHIVEKILQYEGLNVGLIGTMGSRWSIKGVEEELIDLHHTTPQCIDFYDVLNRMVENNVSHVAVEVSSHALSQKRVGLCNFASACLTNITQDHLDFHITMENYKQAKALLFESLIYSSHDKKYAVLNRDEPVFDQFQNILKDSDVKVVSFGFHQDASYRVKSQSYSREGTAVSLSTPFGDLDLKLKLVGRFNLYNVLAAIAITAEEGVALPTIKKGLESFTGVDGRFEVVSVDSEKPAPLCIVDYAHTPDGLENVLTVAKELVPEGGQLIALFGCGGDRDTSKRPQMGKIAEAIAHKCVVTSDNPRSEDPKQIIADILAGLSRMQNVTVEEDREKAIDFAVQEASSKDIIVVAGKGHETYQLVNDQVLDFDDREKVRNALLKRLSFER